MSETQPEVADAGVDSRHIAGVVIGAVVLALYASWMAADLVARWLTLPATAVVAGYLLSGRENGGAKTVFVGYALAAMLAVTPVVMILPDVLGEFTEGPVAMGLTAANLLLVVLFFLPAAVLAYATYRLDGGQGIIERVRGME